MAAPHHGTGTGGGRGGGPGLSACSGGSSTATGGATGGATDGASDATFIFAGSADPITLDGAYVSDGESLRAIQQIFEGLVTSKPGTTEIIPNLAESWTTSPDGKTWTFALKSGVTFTDGTPFDAAAVCTNFDRWYNFKGIQQSSSIAYYWTTVFGGFAKNEDDSLPPSLYSRCEAPDATTAKITLTKASSTFLSALSLPSFFIASPKALTEFKADEVSGTADAPVFSGTFGSEHPIGTGPFKLAKWEKGNQLVLERNDDYWGAKAKIKTLVLKPIADGPARRQALEAGDIDGYDLVDPSDVQALKDAGFEILNRPAFNVAYVGFNQAIKPLDNPKVRQAIAYALNRRERHQDELPRGRAGRDPVHAAGGLRLRQGRPDLPVRPGEGQGPARRGRPAEPDRRVLVPDRRVPAVHAEPRGELPALQEGPRGRRLQGHDEVRAVEPGLPEPGRRRARRRSTCSAGPATSATRTTSSARSSSRRSSPGATRTPSSSACSTGPRRRPTWPSAPRTTSRRAGSS